MYGNAYGRIISVARHSPQNYVYRRYFLFPWKATSFWKSNPINCLPCNGKLNQENYMNLQHNNNNRGGKKRAHLIKFWPAITFFISCPVIDSTLFSLYPIDQCRIGSDPSSQCVSWDQHLRLQCSYTTSTIYCIYSGDIVQYYTLRLFSYSSSLSVIDDH